MTFILLTQGNKDKTLVLVNVDQIVDIFPLENIDGWANAHASVCFNHPDNYIYTEETPSQIRYIIDQAQMGR